MPQPRDDMGAAPKGLHLYVKHHDWNYRFTFVGNQFRKEDTVPSPKDGHRGVEVYDGQYLLKFQIKRNANEQRYQVGRGEAFNAENYSPLMFGYWTASASPPVDKKFGKWSEFLETSQVSKIDHGRDPKWGPITTVEFSTHGKYRGTMELADELQYFPVKIELSNERPGSKLKFLCSTERTARVNGLPMAVEGIYDASVIMDGETIQREQAHLVLTDMKVNEPGIKVDFSIPDGTPFDTSLDGKSGSYVSKNNKLVPAPPEEDHSVVILVGAIASIVVVGSAYLLARRARRNRASDEK
jgi:hypothetical protein